MMMRDLSHVPHGSGLECYSVAHTQHLSSSKFYRGAQQHDEPIYGDGSTGEREKRRKRITGPFTLLSICSNLKSYDIEARKSP